MKIARALFVLYILYLNAFILTKAQADTIDSITDTLESLTCETQGVGDLLRTEFSHTCIPAPFFTFLVANILSPGLYANTMLRVMINDEELFPGACKRENRLDPAAPRLSFSLCNNIKLATVRSVAVADSAVAIAAAMFTGEDPWDDIKNSWTYSKRDYHEIFENKKEGDSGTMIDVGIIPAFPWKVIRQNDRLCVATIGFSGWIPIGCKYIKEPYPKSIYSSFMDGGEAEEDYGEDMMSLMKCSNVGNCYKRAYDNSKTALVITSPIIECIKEMTTTLLIGGDVCSFDDIYHLVDSSKRESSSFFQFQQGMYKAVTAFLTIYVIIYGFKIILLGSAPPKAEMVNFVIKIIFVFYFSVGISTHPYGGSDYSRLDGMIEWAFPFLLGGINELAGWIMSASTSQLCSFDSGSYKEGFTYLSLWDSLDCRVTHYLGLDAISSLAVEAQARGNDFKNFDFFNFSIPPYFYLLFPAIMTGNMMLVSLALMYPLLVISVAAYLVNSTIVCMIAIVILGVLSPIFVPMILFEYTRGYFESWVKLLISFLLQPMVSVTFMITIFSLYDTAFYGTCQYTSKEVTSTIISAAGSTDRKVNIFYINDNWNDSAYTTDTVNKCKKSLGYMINNPLSTFYDFSKDNVNDMLRLTPQKDANGNDIPLPSKQNDKEFMKNFEFLNAITFTRSMLFVSPKMIFERIKDLMLALITACFTLYLMYYFSAQLSEFAADMTEGVALNNVTINPQTIYKAGMQALSAAGNLAKDRMGKSEEGKARDNIATGSQQEGGAAQDKIAIGADSGGDAPASDGVSVDDVVADAVSSSDTSAFNGRRSSSLQQAAVDKMENPEVAKDILETSEISAIKTADDDKIDVKPKQETEITQEKPAIKQSGIADEQGGQDLDKKENKPSVRRGLINNDAFAEKNGNNSEE